MVASRPGASGRGLDVGPSGSPDFTAADFPGEPELQCDIVMKGGITSGVVYPLAVCELATTYRLRSVGGASAGAIAAAAAVAAEMGRRSLLTRPAGPAVQDTPAATADPAAGTPAPPAPTPADALPRGFLGLAQFPRLLAANQSDGRSLLFHLFRPQPEAERSVRAAVGRAGAEDQAARTSRRGYGCCRPRWPSSPTPRRRRRSGRSSGSCSDSRWRCWGSSDWSGSRPAPARSCVVTLELAVVVGALGTLVGLFIALLSGVLADLGRLPSVGFGMSSGRGADDSELALTPWLYRRLQDLAGRPYDQPLTFGDLQADELQLQMMTTNLSRSQPMAMPWNDDIYFFKPDEFEKLFGPVVVQAMLDHPPPLPSGPAGRRIREVLLIHAGCCGPSRELRTCRSSSRPG